MSSGEYYVRNLPDKVVLRLYKLDPNPIYAEIILDRYKYFILKVIGNWHSRNTHCVKLIPSDLQDVHQYAKLAVLLFMAKVKDLSRVKNVFVSIKSYIYTVLNKHYRYYKYETPDAEIFKHADKTIEPYISENFDLSIVEYDALLYLRYNLKYNYYKLGLLFTGMKKNEVMRKTISRTLKKKIKLLRVKLRGYNIR